MDVFPLIPGLEITKEPFVQVIRSTTDSGVSRRRIQWQRPLHRFTISLPGLRKADMETLYNFWFAQRGGLRPFKFQFPRESAFTGQPTRLVSSGVYQAQVRYGADYAKPWTVDQKLLIPGTVNVYIDGVLQDPSTYTLDEDEGTITMDPTEGTVTVDFKRYYKCVFSTDSIPLRQTLLDFFKVEQIVLLEVV